MVFKVNGFFIGFLLIWGIGVVVDFILGFYIFNNGLCYWFDFYRIFKIKLVVIYFGNEVEFFILLLLRLF